jgi:hypothetical protein
MPPPPPNSMPISASAANFQPCAWVAAPGNTKSG